MFALNCNGRLLNIDKSIVMGIINITPDSFYSGSRYESQDEILNRAAQMINEGATILDIGGQSTRPGSTRLRDEEELERVLEPISSIRKEFPEIFISIDTFYSLVAKEAVRAGADIVNDISAGSLDEQLIETVAALKVPYVLMHMKGNPQNMQQQTHYENVTENVYSFLKQKKAELIEAGIKDIIVDPGFGFGKNISQNFELLKNLSIFKDLDSPILLGISRKSFIYKTLGISAADALNGTTVLNTIGLSNGASILRVHDVRAAREAIELVHAEMK
ncbi:MAG TPA: dihydropteroate synthase [Chitinophagaceae bacterium]|nr:dihydropteroate synthase [Chitinophagaceae bacterium]HNF46491.1 dihydropteroate synthase [Chitinophagaceae bacterium]HNO55126.1 dihydropteroate synthase [Chitinophagaceae bacterium]